MKKFKTNLIVSCLAGIASIVLTTPTSIAVNGNNADNSLQTIVSDEKKETTTRESLESDGYAFIGPNQRNIYTSYCSYQFFAKNPHTKKIAVEDGTVAIQSIGLVGKINSLESIFIPSSVRKIDSGAFQGCFSLSSIIVDEENPNFCSEDGILYNKEKTRIIAYPANKDSNIWTAPETLTKIEHFAFYRCRKLNNVNLGDKISYIGQSAFYDCTQLESIDLPDSVTFIGNNLFANCLSLRYVKLPNKIKYIPQCTFFNCQGLDNIVIPDSVVHIGDSAFYHCRSLTDIKLSEQIEFIDISTFRKCRSLQSICLPKSVDLIHYYAFAGCKSLRNVEHENSSIKVNFHAFKNCLNLETKF